MNRQKEKHLKNFLIISAITPAAVRNQGKGLINPIRNKLIEKLSFRIFFKNLSSKNENSFRSYLNYLTDEVAGLPGISDTGLYTGDDVKWGTARKCINLVLRSVVYNGHFWEDYKITDNAFSTSSKFQRLELPLDSNVVFGLKKRLNKINHPLYNEDLYRNFRIIKLNPQYSIQLQEQANALSKELNKCKIDLDLILWRPQEEEW